MDSDDRAELRRVMDETDARAVEALLDLRQTHLTDLNRDDPRR